MKTFTENILESSNLLSDRKLARKVRMSLLDGFVRLAADGNGILGHPTGSEVNYSSRERTLVERGGTPEKNLYGVGLTEKKEVTQIPLPERTRSLSTRYSPDRPGVMTKRISDGVAQDPYTNKIYDWANGFTSESGEVFPGGSVALQTDLFERN